MRGRSIPLSPVRKLVVDLTRLHAPTVPVQRVMDLTPLVATRARLNERPPWVAIFTKAYGLLSDEMPMLRRAYVKLPTPRLYEYPVSTASIVIERDFGDEMAILTLLMLDPAKLSVSEIGRQIRHAKTAPVAEIRSFQRMLDLARWPMPLRRLIWWLGLNIGRQRGNYFGSFGITVYSGLGAESLHPLSPLTATMNWGVIGDDGKVAVRIMYDHRVLDGAQVARVLERLEQKLTNEMVAELTVPQP
ncbi:MAG TPA: hypothetical protein VMP03_10805 [Methylomirabilota bacterium]|nr:hypothetical protein [Methylomirabilota bacterium]